MEYNTDYGTGNKRNTVLYGFEKPVPESTASSLFDITQNFIGKCQPARQTLNHRFSV